MFMALIAMLFILILPGCDQSGDDGADPPPSSGRYESVEDMANLAGIDTGGTYTAILGSGINISNRWADINAAVLQAKKHVILDLGACAVTDDAIAGGETPSGNDFNIIRYNPYITGIILPESLLAVEDYAFSGCFNLVSVVLPEGLISIGGYVFSGCSLLEALSIPDSLISIGNRAFQNCTRLVAVNIPASVEGIGTYAFANCTSLTAITIPEGILTIQDSIFSGCTNLVSVNIPASVTRIVQRAFYDCSSLGGSITIPAAVYNTIETFAFSRTGITEIIFEARTIAISIGPSAFANCTVLTTVVFEDTNITISNDNCFPSGASLRSVYPGGGAGTYTLSGGSWSKN
jgi:hypothetical protein